MRLENNFVQVENNPVVINKVNSVAAAFGWTVQSIQVTDTSVAYQSGAVGWTTEFGTFVNSFVNIKRTTYASITYQRDRDDSKYSQWVALEREYNAIEEKSYYTEQERQEIVAHFKKQSMMWAIFAGLAFIAATALMSLLSKVDGSQAAIQTVCAVLFALEGVVMCIPAVSMYGISMDVRKAEAQILKTVKSGSVYNIVNAANDRKQAAKQEVLDRAAVL